MLHIEELNTEEDVENLSSQDMFYIDKLDIMKNHKEFNNEIVADTFAREWVLRGIGYPHD